MIVLAARKTTKSLSFEEGLNRLEAIADTLEKGDLPLDELLKFYEEGVKLSEELTQKLEAAQGKMMEVRAGKDGKPQAVATDVVRQQNLLDGLDENGGMA